MTGMTFIETAHPRTHDGKFAEKEHTPAEAALPSPGHLDVPEAVADVYAFDREFHAQHGVMQGEARERAFAKAVKEKFGHTSARYHQLLIRHPEYRTAMQELRESGIERPTGTQTRALLYGMPVKPAPFITQRVLNDQFDHAEIVMESKDIARA